MVDLGSFGSAVALLAGAGLSAFGGYTARRFEDRRARRAELLVTVLDPVVRGIQAVGRHISTNQVPSSDRTRELALAANVALRHAHATSRSDAEYAERIKSAAVVLHRLSTDPASRFEDVAEPFASTQGHIDDYLSYLVRKLHRP